MTEGVSAPKLRLVGSVSAALFSLPMEEWQKRAWGKQNVSDQNTGSSTLIVGSEWVLSPSLASALARSPGAALLVARDDTHEAVVAGLHARSGDDVAALADVVASHAPDIDALKSLGYVVGGPEDHAGSYNEALRKKEVPYALSTVTTSPRDIEKRLFAGSYKGATDLVTKYVWPVPALFVTRLCAAARLTPNMVTTASLLFMFLALWFFWEAWWVAGFACGWLMTFLDTVDGKLARTTMTYSKWGNVYDHGIDLIHPPFWYVAWYFGVLSVVSEPPTWLFPALIVILAGYLAGRLLEGLFILRNGFEGHVWKPIDSFVREIIARRNPNMLIFMAFTLAGRPDLGLGAVAIWTLLSTAFQAIRLLQSLSVAKADMSSWLKA